MRDYALLVNMARKAGVSESDHVRMDAYLDKWLADTKSSRYHSTFKMWLVNYRTVRENKRGIEENIERLQEMMAAGRPVSARVQVRRVF